MIAALASALAEIDRLRLLLADVTTRFERALIESGTDPEFAAIACAQFRAAATEPSR